MIVVVTATCIFRQGAATNKLPSAFSLYGLFLAYGYDRATNPYIYNYQLQVSPSFKNKEYEAVNHIVLVIDESIRADYSPFRYVNTQDWFVYNYGNTFSYANASAPSNILLRKGARFETLVQDFYQNPLIWEYAKKAGYITYLIDNQAGGVGHDYFDGVEREMIDYILPLQDSDKDIPKMMKYLKEKEKTFTIIIKKGAHFPYDAYPKDFISKIKLDDYLLSLPMRQKYFKSLEYQSIGFWNEFLKLKNLPSTLVIYTSDHGQNLGDREGLTHGSTENPYRGEGIVPLVILSNFQDLNLQKYQIQNHNQASHFNIVPTILDAIGFDVAKLGYKGINGSLYGDVESPNGFFYGMPFGYFGKKPNFKELEK